MIDANVQRELNFKFNPEGSVLRKMQIRMLEMLMYIDNICRVNGIKYWLSSGTCLGAIRHEGFIPWDDDCDIEMEFHDYNRLTNILRKESPNSQFKLQDVKSEKKYFLPFSRLRDTRSLIIQEGEPNYKVRGCWIDIFPLEKNSSWAMKLSAKIHNVLLNPKFHFHISNKYFENISKKFYFSIFTPFIRTINIFTNKKYLFHTYGICFYKKRYVEDVKEIVYTKFESVELPVPKNYHHYLTCLYGDYMSLPSIENRVAHEIKNVNFF